MASTPIEFSHGEITLTDHLGEDHPVPGVLKRLNVKGGIQFDDGDVDARSGKNRTNMGWEDAEITVDMELLTDDDSNCYGKLALLNYLFQLMDDQHNPVIYSVKIGAHIAGRRIDNVIFAGLTTREGDLEDIITAELRFVEHEPYACQFEPGGTARLSVSTPSLDAAVLGGMS